MSPIKLARLSPLLLVLPFSLILAGLKCSSSTNKETQKTVETEPNEPHSNVVNLSSLVIGELNRPNNHYTQGLIYLDGVIYEGTGIGSQESKLYSFSPNQSQNPQEMFKLPGGQFGEGIAYFDNKIYQLTWQDQVIHIHNVLKKNPDQSALSVSSTAITPIPKEIREGWGLAVAEDVLLVSNGSHNIFVMNPYDFSIKGIIPITFQGKPLFWLNELEYVTIENKSILLANIYKSNKIAAIKLDIENQSAETISMLNFNKSDHFNKKDLDHIEADSGYVLNGIAYGCHVGACRLFITGKMWPKIFEIDTNVLAKVVR